MTGFDETVPPDGDGDGVGDGDDADRDERAAPERQPEPRIAAQTEGDDQDVMPEHNDPEHDSTAPAFEDEPDPDEMPRGQYGPTADYGDG